MFLAIPRTSGTREVESRDMAPLASADVAEEARKAVCNYGTGHGAVEEDKMREALWEPASLALDHVRTDKTGAGKNWAEKLLWKT